ncbi:condensation domain-containing protein [Clostridium sp. C8-1-8]|uniref:condensation domain-containing protein n=1 Tax=Clostridium sp. C8-1-8 TaxID=2698831 RepID=UPI00136B88C6|nr:condensation domain-containing protein [Clostridium sp. C8-1-8]
MFSNLIEAFLYQAENSNNGITFVNVESKEYISYKELFIYVKEVLSYFRSVGIKRGENIILQLNNPYEFIVSFWAGILGGCVVIPVPVTNTKESITKAKHIQQLLGDGFIISNPSIDKLVTTQYKINEKFKKVIIDFNKIKTLDTNFELELEEVRESDIAFIQMSSGSTSLPKGIINSHKNVISNCNSMSVSGNATCDDKFISWLPLTHNMGLVTLHILPLIRGISQIIMPTEMFLRNPFTWLKAISESRATVTASPNFGFKLCIQQLLNGDLPKDIDLSSIRLIISGAEPVSAEVCYRFLNILSKYNIRQNCIVPSYGLAEACLGVSMGFLGDNLNVLNLNRSGIRIGSPIIKSEIRDEFSVTSVGLPLEEVEIRIVNDDGVILPEEYIGHIQVRGDNVTSGYYNNIKETLGAITENGWLNTGDVGVVSDKFLYITGRSKEMIIINGVNYYLHDIERVVIENNFEIVHQCAAVDVYNNELKTEEIIIFVKLIENVDKTNFLAIGKKIHDTIERCIGIPIGGILEVQDFPTTNSGKIQRYVLKDEYESNSLKFINEYKKSSKNTEKKYLKVENSSRLNHLEQYMIEQIAIILDEEKEMIDVNTPFSELGIASIEVERLFCRIENYLGIKFDITAIWNYPTIRELSAYLLNKKSELYINDEDLQDEQIDEEDDIAIIGMGCRFPGNADNPHEYWENLINKKDCITAIPVDRKDLLHLKQDEYFGGYLRHIDMFDTELFSISPIEANKMDPQQRILLMVTYDALLSTEIAMDNIKGSKCGVFIGISSNDYSKLLNINRQNIDVYMSTGNSLAIAANRISYYFNLNGPSMAIDTACSSSLVAIHNACNSIKNGECNLAIAGGVNLMLLEEITNAFSNAGMLAKDFKCKTFDESADGYVRGEGCGIVILKKLRDAVRDKNNIFAIIKGSSVNQDGKSNGLTAPNGSAQVSVIKQALKKAKIRAEEVTYIEAHGTGTRLGDPIEVNSINEVYGVSRTRDNPCYIGSVKTNIGHLEAAAGIASLIKTALILNENKIPPILNFKSMNPYINIDKDIIKIAVEEEVSLQSKEINYAAISSFGFGGTNAHVILQRYNKKKFDIPKSKHKFSCQSYWLKDIVTFSAKENNKDVIEEISTDTIGEFTVSLIGKGAEESYTEIEKLVANIWGEQLGFHEIDVDKTFYEMGGDSISALKIVNKINKILALQVNVSDILKYQSIKEFAQFLDKNENSQLVSPYTIDKAEYMEKYPLSAAQKRVYILNQSRDIGTSYNMPFSITIKGDFNIERFESAFNKLVEIHESFRTSFHYEDGEPVQVIHSKENVKLKIEYISIKEGEIEDYIKDFVKAFDLQKPPLLHVALLKINNNKYVVIVDIHHIISDGTSMGILLKDFADLYNGKEVMEGKIQYKDFAVWEQKFDKKEFKKQQKQYWINMLKGGVHTLNLPTDFPRKKGQFYEGDIIEFNFEKEFTDKIKTFCTHNSATLFTVLLSCYYILLAKYSGQEDLVIGSPISGRSSEEIQNVIGMFVNMLPLRARPVMNKSYKEFLAEVKNVVLNAYKNQDCQFDELADELSIERELGRNPLFDTVFALQNMTIPKVEIDKLEISMCNNDTKAKFDIILEAMETDGVIKFDVKYRVDLFSKSTIERFIKDYISITKISVDSPEILIKEIELEQRFDLLEEVSLKEIEFDF